jgi:hypothetical protein
VQGLGSPALERQPRCVVRSLAAAAISIGLLSGCVGNLASSPSHSAGITTPAAAASTSPQPAASVSSQPAASGCPGPDVTLLELIAIGRGEARHCFGDTQLTLRGWVWEDRGVYDCVKYSAPGDPVPPDWLYCAATHHARLTPAPYPPGEPVPGTIRPGDGPFMVAVDSASPAAGVVLPNQWVEVVGRFDDPVIELCELVVDPNFREPCLSTFVVREARVIDEP